MERFWHCSYLNGFINVYWEWDASIIFSSDKTSHNTFTDKIYMHAHAFKYYNGNPRLSTFNNINNNTIFHFVHTEMLERKRDSERESREKNVVCN